MSNDRSKVQNAITWARITAEVCGFPVMIVLVCSGIEKTVFTTTCQVAGFRCEHSFIASNREPKEEDKLSILENVVGTMADDMGYAPPKTKPRK